MNQKGDGTLSDIVRPSRAWYEDTISEFIVSSSDQIFASLAKNPEFSLLTTQKAAWLSQIELMREQLVGFEGAIFFEFNIPRMGRRIDAVLVIGPVVFAVEFKVGESDFNRAAIDQVWDYALDLKNFHEASHEVSIVPVLVATDASEMPTPALLADGDGVFQPVLVPGSGLRMVVDRALTSVKQDDVDCRAWASASYRPTPTIVEAARSLYAQHSVDAIARFDAGAKNLRVTSQRIEELVAETRTKRKKLICFVTGVPGAGKTLVGLNVATHRREERNPNHSVFLSGNAPLVAVLREALTRDEFSRRKSKGEKVRKSEIGEGVKAFIQNIHHFRDDALVDPSAPVEHVVIFDEAQRAWNLRQTASFMSRKKTNRGLTNLSLNFWFHAWIATQNGRL